MTHSRQSPLTTHAESSKSHRARARWEINTKLLIGTLLFMLVGIAGGWYLYNRRSAALGKAFVQRATEAKVAGDLEKELIWLKRFQRLAPDDKSVVLQIGFLADEAANLPPANRYDRVEEARRRLSDALATLNEANDPTKKETQAIQRKLIGRLSQFGDHYSSEIETLILRLAPNEQDKEILRMLAMSRAASGQITPRAVDGGESPDRKSDFWRWLFIQPPLSASYIAWQQNRGDLDLAQLIVDQIRRSQQNNAATPNLDTNHVLGEVAEYLRTNPPSDRSALIQFYISEDEDPERALDQLKSRVDLALEKLTLQVKPTSTTDKNLVAPSTEEASALVLPPATYSPSEKHEWSYLLVATAASATLARKSDNESSREQAAEAASHLEKLLACVAPKGFEQVTSAIFEAYFRYAWQVDQGADNLEILEQGIKQLGPHALNLHILHAKLLSEKGLVEKLSQAIQDLERARQEKQLLLQGPWGQSLPVGLRNNLQAELGSADWNATALTGALMLERGEPKLAASILQEVIDSQLPASAAERLLAATQLAKAFELNGKWDLAATAYERAASYAENSDQFTELSALNWEKSGNTQRSLKQWAKLSQKSPRAILLELTAKIREEYKKNPTDRNFDSIRKDLEGLQWQLNQQDDSTEKVQSQLARIALLTLGIPDRNDGKERALAVSRLADLAAAQPDIAEIQVASALGSAVAGDYENSDLALERLKRCVGSVGLEYIQTLAKVEASRGQTPLAIEKLIEVAKVREEDSVELLSLAADLALDNQEPREAFQMLQRIPANRQTPELIFRIFSLANSLYTSDQNQEISATVKDSDTPIFWEARMREKEGGDGTWWRLAKATRLLSQLKRAKQPTQTNTKFLQQASLLQKELEKLRPRWGLVHTLKGQIAAKEGNTSVACEALRRGRQQGDNRAETTLLLISQLTAANRLAEAEAEFGRFSRYTSSNSAISAIAQEIARKKGDFDAGLKLARRSAESQPRSLNAWLLLAQAAILAGKSTQEQLARESLAAEAKLAVGQAMKLSNDSNLVAYQLAIQFEATFFAVDDIKRAVTRLLSSNVSEPSRSIYAIRVLLELKMPEAAHEALRRVQEIAPKNPDVYVAAAQYHGFIGDRSQKVAALEQAHSLAPNRLDIRNRLALALALENGTTPPWKRLQKLLDSDAPNSSTQQNRLLHALILMNRGGEEEQKQAADILRQIRNSGGREKDDAGRLLATLEQRKWGEIKDKTSTEAIKAQTQVLALYEPLTRRLNPRPTDLYRYGDYLIRAKMLKQSRKIADALDRISFGSAASLHLRLKIAQASGNDIEAGELTRKWADRLISSGAILQENVWETAGRTLASLGFHEEAVEWLAQGYKSDPSKFRDYVIALTRSQDFVAAIDACRREFEIRETPEAIALMADILILNNGQQEIKTDVEQILQFAQQRHGNIPSLLEAIGTLRLSQQEYSKAVSLYERAEKLAPDNARLLNNLAMALSEIEGREAESLPKIQRAIELNGRSPELVDTLGIVLMRNDQIEEAVEAIAEATANSPDPRFRFHLVIALLEQNKRAEALAQWAQLDLNKLRKHPLTPAEKKDLGDIEKTFSHKE